MPHYELTHGWALEDNGIDVVITGPGHLAITLSSFDAQQLRHEEGVGSVLLGTVRQLVWSYLLGEIELQYSATWDIDVPDQLPVHRLHVGPAVLWQLPDEVGTRLQAWFAQVEEGHR